MAEHPAEDLLRRFHHELWVNGDLSAIDRHVDPNARTAMTGFDASTVDALREDVERYVAAFDEVTSEIVELIVEDDRAAMWWRTSGRHVGPFGHIAPEPTHRRINMEGVWITMSASSPAPSTSWPLASASAAVLADLGGGLHRYTAWLVTRSAYLGGARSGDGHRAGAVFHGCCTCEPDPTSPAMTPNGWARSG